ncbi:ArsR/SmtB family transcription factor [Virgibacillus necropolis]|uniref:Transcriptional regulator n=1 Tax=Virgibacillus necropolis TaxID=163877 RepID=A0A221M7A6_9BACI|nr:metalloregulator ArsR/SmtB family transcription factor [Virgibacillus necropolis]ASN03525.1 transcriptional regulator [Virgibacillus necropolis]
MEVVNMTSRKRETYQIKLEHSLLWECALGIAAVTNARLIDTLEKSDDYWKGIKQSLSDEMLEHLNYVEENNTWKSLLQLLHQREFTDLTEFKMYIKNLTPEEMKYICIPYLGMYYQDIRNQAAYGDEAAINELKNASKDNPFFPTYIEYIGTVDTETLTTHLCLVMEGWYTAAIEPEADKLEAILERDIKAKKKMQDKMSAEELVEWATGGSTYHPEPSVYYVLLIPQYVYRPWNIVADVEGVKVFYYPVSNESIHPGDVYQPDNFLVHKHKALGDEVRLKIVKYLAEGDCTLQTITNKLAMGKSTIHHHLKILRSAKLVDINHSKYRLKRNTLDAMAKELQQYVYGK